MAGTTGLELATSAVTAGTPRSCTRRKVEGATDSRYVCLNASSHRFFVPQFFNLPSMFRSCVRPKWWTASCSGPLHICTSAVMRCPSGCSKTDKLPKSLKNANWDRRRQPFQAWTTCILNDLTGLGGLHKFLKGRERQTYLGWRAWVCSLAFPPNGSPTIGLTATAAVEH